MNLKISGHFEALCLNEDGSLAWKEIIANSPTLEGLTYLLGATFNGASQLSAWKVGLMDASNFTSLSTSDTMPSHAGWSELTSYSQSGRVAWSPISVSGALASNTAVMVFTFSSAGQLAGIFVSSEGTKGGTSGTLWATALFALTKQVVKNQQLQLIYVVRAAGGT